MPPRSAIRFLSHEEIRAAAERLIREHFAQISIPVQVERLVERRLGIRLIPSAGLKAKLKIDGFISPDGSSITVDSLEFRGNTNRYRFTLAHELGHWALHKDFLGSASYRTPSAYRQFHQSLAAADLKRLEWQANRFAGVLLLPSDPLTQLARTAIASLSTEASLINLVNHQDCLRVAGWIAQKAQVSSQVVMRRGIEEGLWISLDPVR